jgi:predicted nucleic acid-binding protein
VELRRVFLDANVLIYLIEGVSPASESARKFVEECQNRGDRLFTSALAIGEVLVKPTKDADVDLLRRYRAFFESPAIEVVTFGSSSAAVFAQLRAVGIKAPDAIHLSCASVANIDLFVTNDQRLSRQVVPGVLQIRSLDL